MIEKIFHRILVATLQCCALFMVSDPEAAMKIPQAVTPLQRDFGTIPILPSRCLKNQAAWVGELSLHAWRAEDTYA